MRARGPGRLGWVLALGVAGAAGACDDPGQVPRREHFVAGGDAARGRAAIRVHGCEFCHRIPGVEGLREIEGPPLDAWADRRYIAGQLPNRAENLVLWIMDPHAVEPGTAMPNLGVSEADARDIAAYLYTLGGRVPEGPLDSLMAEGVR